MRLEDTQPSPKPPLRTNARPWGAALVAVAAFHLAYSTSAGMVIAVVPFGLLPLASLGTARRTFYAALVAGLACVGPQLGFFWGIFGPAALLLWGILAAWMAIALVLIRACRLAWGDGAALLLTPWIWTGCEYFRSELYFLRFSWLNSGYALAGTPFTGLLPLLGSYGVGFVFWAAAGLGCWAPGRWRRTGPLAMVLTLLLGWAGGIDRRGAKPPTTEIPVAGAQVESVPPSDLPRVLDRLLGRHPSAQLLVLPEYSLAGEPDDALLAWCRRHGRHLVVGGTANLGDGGFLNTAFVIGPEGRVVFQQGKSVPIQFFNDGVPANRQTLWPSPWGPLGLAICYDLSYTRVMDRLVREGAVGLVIPTMDSFSWGAAQHALHARVAPTRAAEYRIPILRVASSGISQIVDARGQTTTRAPFSEEVVLFGGTLPLGRPGQLPIDRVLAPFATCLTALLVPALALSRIWHRPPHTPPLA